MAESGIETLRALDGDPRGDADLVQEIALANLKQALFGNRPRQRIGRYEVRALLGAGGMGVVYRAHDPELERDVAIKVVSSTDLPERARAARARLVREARALATLVHPNVLPIYDVGIASPAETSTLGFAGLYIVMELVEGESLAAWLARRPCGLAEIRRVFAQAARGLAAAHAIGFVHRDFKPGNVLIGTDGRVRVCDFGLVANAGATSEPTIRDSSDLLWDARLSVTRGVIGTPGYIAPESFRGEPIGPRADQYAFCVALWTALYDQHPYFDALGGLDASGCTLRTGSPRVAVPRRLRAAIERGLAQDPEHRWPNMHGIIDALEGKVRRRWGAPGIVAGVVALGAAGLSFDAPQRCPGTTGLTKVWGPAQRGALAATLAGIDAPYAGGSADRVVDGLDAFAQDWADGYAKACEAARRDTAVAASASSRLRCFERRLEELAAVVDALHGTDRHTLQGSVAAVADLTPPRTCDDRQREDTWVPRDDVEVDLVVAITRELAAADALLDARRPRDAVARAERAQALTEQLAGSPLRLEAMNLAAHARDELGFHAEAAEAFETAYFEALARGEEEHAQEAAIGRVAVARSLRDLDTGRQWVAHARALVPPDAPGVASALDRQAGHLEVLAGDARLGAQLLRRALDGAVEAWGPAAPGTTWCRALLADALRQLGHFDEAIDLQRHVLDHQIARVGAGHPDAGLARAELAHTLLQTGDPLQGREEIERALAILEPEGESLALAGVLSTLGGIHHRLQEDELARAAWERALQIRERRLQRDHPQLTAMQRNLGILASEEGRLDDAAALLGAALDAELSSFGPDHHSVANLRYHLAFVYRGRGEGDLAVSTMRESLRALEASRGHDHVDVARPLRMLARWEPDPEQAVRFAERAVRIVDHAESDPELRARAYDCLADALRHQGVQLSRAEQLQARALATCPTDLCRSEVQDVTAANATTGSAARAPT